MRAVIIDDELPSISLMKMMMNKNEYLEVVGEFISPQDAFIGIKELVPDVVFLDIEMPHMTGVELATKIMNYNSNIQIVFVTAYEKYALKAFDVNAVNYILKPITEEVITITVARLLRNYNNMNYNLLPNNGNNKIKIFGEFSVYGNVSGDKIQWATAKAKELFGYFILHRGKEIDKWQLCDILYPDAGIKNAEHSLHSTISRAKATLKKIGIENPITCVKGKYTVDMTNFSCDMWEWHDFMEKNPIISKDNIINYDKLLGIYLGDLFGTENYVWAMTEQERVRKEYLNSLKKMAAYFIKLENYLKAEIYLEKYIMKEPFDEEVAELLLRAYYFNGRRCQISSYYNKLKQTLFEELGVEPRESLRLLYEKLIVNI